MPIYAIEICGPQNECVSFAPAGDPRVRGRWDFVKVTHRDLGEVMKIMSKEAPTIPGQYLVLDTDKREAAVVDPLELMNDGKEILKKINAVYEQFAKPKRQVKPSQYFRELDADTIKTWGAEMAKLLTAKLAVPVTGYATLPKLDEIRAKWPGRRKADPFNSGRQQEKLHEYVDEVPVNAEPAEVGTAPSGGKGSGKTDK